MKKLFHRYANPQLLLIFNLVWDRSMKASPPVAWVHLHGCRIMTGNRRCMARLSAWNKLRLSLWPKSVGCSVRKQCMFSTSWIKDPLFHMKQCLYFLWYHSKVNTFKADPNFYSLSDAHVFLPFKSASHPASLHNVWGARPLLVFRVTIIHQMVGQSKSLVTVRLSMSLMFSRPMLSTSCTYSVTWECVRTTDL